ncbi:DUF1990 family protein [Egicoccus halophilus]|uniref:DUF1990 domain-containing protein n=1 Tax=Egicoccus halophilus TaxID=1670830 RepID=A0A8J3ESY4_9ACTN|nr:DUF1990 domain-containing protein [Egicoccus halophilus]GGI02588.1 hypothetical protein GCM10011354_00870 [Egicoccus halophilus]
MHLTTSPRRRRALLRRLAQAELSYAEVGASRGKLPAGYRHVTRDALVGRGEDAFARVSQGLLSWEMHRRAGLTVDASTPHVTPDATVLLTVGVTGRGLTVPCRVVDVTDEPRRRGFAYGTLPGHVETGEECFEVRHDVDGDVRFRVTAFSRPAGAAMRIVGPLGELALDRMLDRYVWACERLALGVVEPRRG